MCSPHAQRATRRAARADSSSSKMRFTTHAFRSRVLDRNDMKIAEINPLISCLGTRLCSARRSARGHAHRRATALQLQPPLRHRPTSCTDAPTSKRKLRNGIWYTTMPITHDATCRRVACQGETHSLSTCKASKVDMHLGSCMPMRGRGRSKEGGETSSKHQCGPADGAACERPPMVYHGGSGLWSSPHARHVVVARTDTHVCHRFR